MGISQFALGMITTAGLLAGLPALAHHSDAGFDGSKTVSINQRHAQGVLLECPAR